MRDTSLAAGAPPEIRAEVRVQDRVMRYVRSGGGPPVVVLGSPAFPSPVWPELQKALAGRFRLIVPDLPRCDEDIAAWLAAFLEGLGSTDVGVVASTDFCIPALELALADMDRIARVVLVPRGDGGLTGLDGSLATAARGAAVPLLIVRRGLPAEQAVPLVIGFLGENRRMGAGAAPY